MSEFIRDEAFEESYSQICKPIIARPYPRNEKGEYIYKEIHEAYLMWQASQANAVLKDDCMIGKHWYPKGTPVSALINRAKRDYKTEVAAQNSKIKFGTDDNEIWWAHDVPYFGTVQMDYIKSDDEWDIYFGECWQGPFSSKSRCIQHLEECIQEKKEESGEKQ